MKEIVFATHNPNKVKEVAQLLEGHFKVLSLTDIGCNEDIPETATTLEGNARIKSMHVWENYGRSCFADDTALEVAALDGKPGVRSARFAGEHCNSEDNMALLLEKMAGVDDRTARFRTIVSLVMEGEEFQFEGIASGTITESHSGDKGFGYDPIFQPDGYDRTFAQMSTEEKNAISHRAKAVKKLIDFLRSRS